MDAWGIVFFLLPVAMAILPFIGYGRTQRLQAFVRDPRLTALGWFFLLYGASALVQSGGGFVVFYSGERPGPDDPFTIPLNATDGSHGDVYWSEGGREYHVRSAGNGTEGNGTAENGTAGQRVEQFRHALRAGPVFWPFWLHHGLVIAALLVVAIAYIRPTSPAIGGAVLAGVPFFVVGNAMLQTVEAVLALVPFVMALLNWRRRQTRGSLQVAIGFLLIALAHLAFVPLVLTRPPVLVPLFDVLALAGIATLVFAVPRGP